VCIFFSYFYLFSDFIYKLIKMLPKKLFTPKCLHSDRDIVFKDDIENFYSIIINELLQITLNTITNNELEVVLINNLNYNFFKHLWKDKKMSMLHYSKTKEENAKEYYEVIFGEIQQFFNENYTINNTFPSIKSFKIIVKILAVFTLYSVYYTQTYDFFYQINTIPEILNEINNLIKLLNQSEKINNIKLIKELALMVSRMYNDDAFSIGTIIGLKTIMLNKYGLPLEQKTNVFKDYLDINDSFKSLLKEKDFTGNSSCENYSKDSIEYNSTKQHLVELIKSLSPSGTNSIFNTQFYCDVMNNKLTNSNNNKDHYNQQYNQYPNSINNQKNDLLLTKNDFNQNITNIDIQFFQVENNIFNINNTKI
jgi:hypothetical protein